MNPLSEGGFLQRLNGKSRFASTFVVMVTLALGILIGSVVSYSVKGKTIDTSDAALLQMSTPQQMSSTFAQIAKKLEPSVVNINTESIIKPNSGGSGQGGDNENNPFQDFMNKFFGGQGPGMGPANPEGMTQRSLGSGVIVDPKGYIVTNFHVIDHADKIRVNLMGDPPSVTYKATVVGSDKETDLAVLKIDVGHPLPAAKLGDSDAMQVGDWVLAIGSPFGLNETVTAGIISATERNNIVPGRQFQSFIQTDAAINPGNSGGPLVNMSGQVIGINTAIYTQSSGYQGIGFAMPANTVLSVYNQIISSPDHKVSRGSLGIEFQAEPNPALAKVYGSGVVVSSVVPGGPAEAAGLKTGDAITAVDGKPVKSGDQLAGEIANRKPGTKVRITYTRDGKPEQATVTLADREKLFGVQLGLGESGANGGQPTSNKFGISVRNIPPDQADQMNLPKGKGVVVTKVRTGGFADEIGLGRGDIILEINRQPVPDVNAFESIQSKLKSGDPVVFLIRPHGAGKDTGTFFVSGTLP